MTTQEQVAQLREMATTLRVISGRALNVSQVAAEHKKAGDSAALEHDAEIYAACVRDFAVQSEQATAVAGDSKDPAVVALMDEIGKYAAQMDKSAKGMKDVDTGAIVVDRPANFERPYRHMYPRVRSKPSEKVTVCIDGPEGKEVQITDKCIIKFNVPTEITRDELRRVRNRVANFIQVPAALLPAGGKKQATYVATDKPQVV